jgi:hypothetical protein
MSFGKSHSAITTAAFAGLSAMMALFVGGTPALSAGVSQVATLQAELKVASMQTQLQTPLNPNPSLGLEANYGPNTMNWKCNPVRSVASEPLCVLGNPSAKRTLVLFGDSQVNQWGPSFDL